MTHITEDTVIRLRDRITEGVALRDSHFQDHRTPFHSGGWYTADAVSFDKSGRLTVTYLDYSQGARPGRSKVHFDADDMIALLDRDTPQNPARLILSGGGYMIACDGGNLRTWDVYAPDDTPLGREVETVDARAMLIAYAPEMIWVNKGDDRFIARGYGREWQVVRGERNPAYSARTFLPRFWFFDLLSRPLGAEKWETVVAGCETPEAARENAPLPGKGRL